MIMWSPSWFLSVLRVPPLRGINRKAALTGIGANTGPTLLFL
jgi:hypothetical protein